MSEVVVSKMPEQLPSVERQRKELAVTAKSLIEQLAEVCVEADMLGLKFRFGVNPDPRNPRKYLADMRLWIEKEY